MRLALPVTILLALIPVFAATLPAHAGSAMDRVAQAQPALPPPTQPQRPSRPRDLRAATAECAWVGKRTIRVLMRDDLIAAEGFLKFYSAFGCPTRHLGQAFGCAVSAGAGGSAREVETRIEACWADPKTKAAAAPGGPSPGTEAKPVDHPLAKGSRPATSRTPPAATYPKR